MTNIMGHEQLRDKLESMDLTKVDGIQWNQKHTWSRLNGQLQSDRKRRIVWYYPIAASVVLLIVFMSGYFLMKHSSRTENKIDTNENKLAMNHTIVKEEVLPEVCDPAETSDTVKTPSIEPSTMKTVANIIQKKKRQEVLAIEMQPEEVVPNEKVQNGTGTVADETIELVPNFDILENTTNILRQTDNMLLTSIPIKQKKNKISVKLFQKQHKSKSNSHRTLSTLTLFASN